MFTFAIPLFVLFVWFNPLAWPLFNTLSTFVDVYVVFGSAVVGLLIDVVRK